MSKYKTNSVIKSFQFAVRGIALSVKSQRNFQIELGFAFIGIILSAYFKLPPVEIAIIALTIGFVLFSEMMNTVIEFVVDAYFGHKYSILAKMAKDISAGAVLVSIIASLGVGIIIFTPRILMLF